MFAKNASVLSLILQGTGVKKGVTINYDQLASGEVSRKASNFDDP